MDKWLAKFWDDTLENGTDKTDILPQTGSVSGMSVPFPERSAEILTTGHPAAPYVPPLRPGWIVTYIDDRGALCGGWDERVTSMVTQCHGRGGNCQVELSDGRRIPLRAVRAVGQTDAAGKLLAAWTVRKHGYDGNAESEDSTTRT